MEDIVEWLRYGANCPVSGDGDEDKITAAEEIESLRAQLAEERQQKHEALHREYCRREELNAQLLATQAHDAWLVEGLGGLHKVCEIALASKDGKQHSYLETRAGHFVAAAKAMESAEAALSTPINLDALHEALARECERLAAEAHSCANYVTAKWLEKEAAAHRAKKEAV